MDLIRSSIKVFLAKIIKAIANFIAIIIFSKGLGASPLGIYYPFLALIGILAVPADFGLRDAVEKRLSEGDELGSYLTTVILLKTPPLIIISVLVVIIREYINSYLGADLALLLVVTLFIQEGAKLSLAVIRGELRVGETALIQALLPIGWLLIGYLCYIYGYGVYSLIYGYMAGMLAMLIVGWQKVSISFSQPTFSHARSLFNYGRYGVISAIGGYFYSWMDVAILSLFVTLEISSSRAGIGAYENAWRITLILLMFSRAISMAIFPQISRWDAEDATTRIENILPIALLPGMLLVIPGFVGTLVLSKDILRILFNPEFTIAWLALIILMGEKILQSVQAILGRSLQAINRPDLSAYATSIAVIINLILNIILIYIFGITGAALATSISFIANTLLHGYYLDKFLNIKFPLVETIWATISSIIMGVTIYSVKQKFFINSIADLILTIIFGGGLYGIILIMHPSIRHRVFKIMKPIIPRIY